jgi:hypothetical protein
MMGCNDVRKSTNGQIFGTVMKKKSEAAWAACLSEIDQKPREWKALEIAVISGENFPCMDVCGLCDPLVRFKIDDGQTITKVGFSTSEAGKKRFYSGMKGEKDQVETSVAKNTLNPIWDETFIFSFMDEENPGKITLEVIDVDDFKDSDRIGTIKVSCETVELWMKNEIGFVESKSYQVMNDDKLVKGTEDPDLDCVVNLSVKVIQDDQKMSNYEV